jgi:hypothetical protein
MGDLIVLALACSILLLAYVIRASVADMVRSIADLREVMARMERNPHELATGLREPVPESLPGKPDKAPKEGRRDLQPAARGTATEQKQCSAVTAAKVAGMREAMRRGKSFPPVGYAEEAAEGAVVCRAKSIPPRATQDTKAHSMHSGPAELVERRRHYGRHPSSAVTPTQRSSAQAREPQTENRASRTFHAPVCAVTAHKKPSSALIAARSDSSDRDRMSANHSSTGPLKPRSDAPSSAPPSGTDKNPQASGRVRAGPPCSWPVGWGAVYGAIDPPPAGIPRSQSGLAMMERHHDTMAS